MNFSEWLEIEKGMSRKSSHDAASRLKRAMNILGTEYVTGEELNLLEEKDEFTSLSITVRSQLRRALRLYAEFKTVKDANGDFVN